MFFSVREKNPTELHAGNITGLSDSLGQLKDIGFGRKLSLFHPSSGWHNFFAIVPLFLLCVFLSLPLFFLPSSVHSLYPLVNNLSFDIWSHLCLNVMTCECFEKELTHLSPPLDRDIALALCLNYYLRNNWLSDSASVFLCLFLFVCLFSNSDLNYHFVGCCFSFGLVLHCFVLFSLLKY